MLCPFGGATGRIRSHPPSLILPPAGDSVAPKPRTQKWTNKLIIRVSSLKFTSCTAIQAIPVHGSCGRQACNRARRGCVLLNTIIYLPDQSPDFHEEISVALRNTETKGCRFTFFLIQSASS